MTAATANHAEAPALLTLLEQLFLSGSDVCAVRARAVSSTLWDDALLNPLRDFLARPGKRFRAELVELGFRLAGGRGSAPLELALIIECLHAGSLIVDDIEDASVERRGAPALHCTYGVPRALNAGNYLYFWPQLLLTRSGLADGARLSAHERIALCLARCHEGQALDLHVRVDSLPQRDVGVVADAISTLKTGALVGLAMGLGALAAGASVRRVDAIAGLGVSMGVGLQILDDVSGIVNVSRRHKALEDLQHGRVTWLWVILSEELDEVAYDGRLRELADVIQGRSGDALVERMRFQAGGLGVRRARERVQTAVNELACSIGGGSWCDDVLAQFTRLERCYVQG